MPKMMRTQVYLTKNHRNYLKSLGEGQISRGIRMMIIYHISNKENKVVWGRPRKDASTPNK